MGYTLWKTNGLNGTDNNMEELVTGMKKNVTT